MTARQLSLVPPAPPIGRPLPVVVQGHTDVTSPVAPAPADLIRAVGEYLETVLRDRKYCNCMGLLPDHMDGCALGKLMDAYERSTR